MIDPIRPRAIRAVALALVLFAPRGAPADDAPDLKSVVPYKLVHEEVGGGSDSAVSPDGKWIAFSSRRSGNRDVWIISTETGELKRITTHPATDNEPRWHPEGTHITFVTMRNGTQDVYTINVETGEETPIATEDNNEDYPSYSKDGSEICYTGGPRGFREVKVYNFASGEHRTLTKGYGYVGSTSFSSDGRRIVFHAYYDGSYVSGRSDVYTISARGGKPTNVTATPDIWDYKPNWSFDGNWIAFASKRTTPNFNIWTMRPDGSELRAVTQLRGVVTRTSSGRVSMSNANPTDLRWPNWTLDGRICFHQINAQFGRLKVVEVATGDVKDLFDSSFELRDLSISPSADRLLFEADAQVRVLDLKPGAEPRVLARGAAPRWAARGESVVYLHSRRAKVGLIAAVGGEAETIDVKPAAWPPPTARASSPDGSILALVTQDEHGRAELAIVTLAGEKRVLLTGRVFTPPVWSGDGKHLYFSENRPASVSYYLTSEPVRKMEF